MDTRYLQTLVAAVETGSFSRAALVLHLTQSAVSQRIKFLEERFDRQLLIRSGPQLVLTKPGEAVLEFAKQVLQLQNALSRDLERLDEKPRLAVCCTPTFGAVYFSPVLSRFMALAGNDIDIRFLFLSPEPALAGIRRQEFDLAIIEHCAETSLESFVTYELPADELVFVSAPSLGLQAPLVDIDALLAKTFFARKDSCSSKKILRAGLQRLGKGLEDFRGVVVSDDLRLNCQAVVEGNGVSFVSRALVQEHLDSGRLVAHQVEGFPHSRQRTIVVGKGREKDPLLGSFIQCINQTLSLPLPALLLHLLLACGWLLSELLSNFQFGPEICCL